MNLKELKQIKDLKELKELERIKSDKLELVQSEIIKNYQRELELDYIDIFKKQLMQSKLYKDNKSKADLLENFTKSHKKITNNQLQLFKNSKLFKESITNQQYISKAINQAIPTIKSNVAKIVIKEVTSNVIFKDNIYNYYNYANYIDSNNKALTQVKYHNSAVLLKKGNYIAYYLELKDMFHSSILKRVKNKVNFSIKQGEYNDTIQAIDESAIYFLNNVSQKTFKYNDMVKEKQLEKHLKDLPEKLAFTIVTNNTASRLFNSYIKAIYKEGTNNNLIDTIALSNCFKSHNNILDDIVIRASNQAHTINDFKQLLTARQYELITNYLQGNETLQGKSKILKSIKEKCDNKDKQAILQALKIWHIKYKNSYDLASILVTLYS